MKYGQWVGLAIVAVAAFGWAYTANHDGAKSAVSVQAVGERTDSAMLANQGIVPGRQLIAYVLVSSRCGYCQRADTKAALAALRDSLQASNGGRFALTSVVGVAVNTDFGEGLGYLEDVGLQSFDEISVGRGWVNEHVKRLVWQDTTSSASVPQIVLLSRMLAAELKPNMAIKVSGDSLVGRLVGYADIVRWVEGGARSDDLVNKRGGK